jgi:hypothetical protein
LNDRIQFTRHGGFASLRQPQLQLTPFDAARLKNVAVRLREQFPTEDRDRLLSEVDDDFIDQLVAKVTEGFAGNVGVVPRQFLRQFVEVMDLLEQEAGFSPRQAYEFKPKDLLPEEEAARSGDARGGDERGGDEEGGDEEGGDGFVPAEEVW